MIYFLQIFVSIIILFFSTQAMSESTLKILSTTSTRDSGFYNYILPIFEKKYGIKALLKKIVFFVLTLQF